jgi:enoyl-CoA hydratase
MPHSAVPGEPEADAPVRYEVDGQIAHVTLARPDRGNSLSMSMRAALVAALRRADSDHEVSVALLDAEGPSFCTGYDLAEPYGSKTERAARPEWVTDKRVAGWSDQFTRSCVMDWLALWDLVKPVVAVVHGNCLGGGTELMSFADVVFVADDARIGYPPVRALSTPDVPFFAWKMSMARAKYLQLTGNSITGREAAEWGWVARSFPTGALRERAWAETRAMSSIDPVLLAANKAQVNQAYELMGMRTHLAQAWSWHQLSSTGRPKAGEFFEIAQREGLRGALTWMNRPFEAEGIT